MRFVTLCVLVALVVPAWADEEPDLEALAARVKDYPTKFRLIAIGRPAIPALMKQVASADEWLAFESKSALRWIANAKTLDAEERRATAHAIAFYVNEDHATAVRLFAAELVGDMGVRTTVGSLAQLLWDQDEAVALAGVDALRRIPSGAAANALAASCESPRAVPAARAAMYRALGSRKERATYPVIVKGAEAGNEAAIAALGDTGFSEAVAVLVPLARDGAAGAFDALVRIVTAHPIGPTLHVTYGMAVDDAQRLRVVHAAAGGEADTATLGLLRGAMELQALRVPAQHAVLALVEREGPREASAAVRWLLKEADDPSVIVRALSVLGRSAEAENVALIQPFLASPDRNVRTLAIVALRETPGDDAGRALLGAFDAASDAGVRTLLIEAFGERGDRAAVPALRDIIGQGEGETDIRNAALDAYAKIADRAAPGVARAMYLEALAAGAGRAALLGLQRVGDASVLPAVGEYLASTDAPTRSAAIDTLLSIAERAALAGHRDGAVAAYKRALEAGVMVENRLRLLGEPVEITARDGRVSAWWIIGPFAAPDIASWSNPELPEEGVDLKKTYGETLRWLPVQVGGSDAVVDLDSMFDVNDRVCAYAFAEIVVKKERDAVLKMGSDDGLRCWLNGEHVHSALTARGLTVDEDSVGVHLKEGANQLLVKVCEGAGGWAFCVRLEDDRGRPLKFKIK